MTVDNPRWESEARASRWELEARAERAETRTQLYARDNYRYACIITELRGKLSNARSSMVFIGSGMLVIGVFVGLAVALFIR